MESCKAHFKDEQHDIVTTIENNFHETNILHSIKIVIDDVAFAGMSFADFELEDNQDFDTANSKFNLLKWGNSPSYYYELQRYSLSIEIPVQIIDIQRKIVQDALICFSFSRQEDPVRTLGSKTMLDKVRVYPDMVCCHEFFLQIDDEIYRCDKPSVDFETSLLQICKMIKGKYYLKCCFGCLYSDYSPYGNDYFATMLCFADQGEIYAKVSSKNELWEVYKGGAQKQETSLCDRFCPRINFPGGYRGLIYT